MLARPRNGERGTHILLVGISTATMRKSVEISLKLEVHLSHDLAILLLSIYPKDKLYQRVICSTIFIAAPFTRGRIWNQSWCPWSIEWIKNMWYMYIHNGILFSYNEHFGWFQIFLIVNSAALNIFQVSLWFIAFQFFGYVPSSGIAEST